MKHGGDLTEAMAQHGGAPDELARSVDRDQSLAVANSAVICRIAFGSVCRRAPTTQALLAAARKAYRVPDGVDIAAAAGTQALIQWLPHLAAPGAVAIVGPTYSEHARPGATPVMP